MLTDSQRKELEGVAKSCASPRDYFIRLKELKKFGSPLVEDMEIDSIIDFADQGRIDKIMEIIKLQEKKYFDSIREHMDLIKKKGKENADTNIKKQSEF